MNGGLCLAAEGINDYFYMWKNIGIQIIDHYKTLCISVIIIRRVQWSYFQIFNQHTFSKTDEFRLIARFLQYVAMAAFTCSGVNNIAQHKMRKMVKVAKIKNIYIKLKIHSVYCYFLYLKMNVIPPTPSIL